MIIGIVGASGFVGKELAKALKNLKLDYVSMSRSHQPQQNWKFIDLFSKSITEESLSGIDVAVYLVHSMLPSSKLTQGTFFDIDILLVDNFIKSCTKNKVKKIIFVSGIIPKDGELSAHLKSRKEVEDLICKSGIPATVIRTGLIIGDRGSSLNILKNIVSTMYILLVPKEIYNKVQVISIEKVIESIINNLEGEENIINIGFAPISYYDLLVLMSNKLKRKIWFIKIGFYPVKLFSFLTSLISGAPYGLVRPLFESLKHNMVSDTIIEGDIEKEIEQLKDRPIIPHAFQPVLYIKKVRSVQRINLSRRTSYPIYKIYYKWLDRSLPFIGVYHNGPELTFFFIFRKVELLKLKFAEAHSSENRQLLFIQGGLLAHKGQDYGRMEFRIIDDRILICAIHDYIPALPWWIYIFTQAQVHLWVMKKFKQFLESKSSHNDKMSIK